MINFTKKLFDKENYQEKLLAEKLKQRADFEQEKMNKANNDFIKYIELNKKKEACNLYLGAYHSKKMLNKYEINQYQNFNHLNNAKNMNNQLANYQHQQMYGSKDYYRPSFNNGVFGEYFWLK